MVVADALRADHVSSYGYTRTTTPNLDALMSDKGALFRDVTSPSSWTYPSNAAMWTGHSPSSLGIFWADPESAIPEEERTLAEHLNDAGYYAAGFVTPVFLGRSGFGRGFDHYYRHPGGGQNRVRAAEFNETAMTWLADEWAPVFSGTQPLFLLLYYWGAHTWYDAPAPYDTLYDGTYTGTLTAEAFGDGKDVVAGVVTPTQRDVQHLIACYDGRVSYWDFHFREMMAYLDDLHLLDDAIIVVTSDHGEMFGEHGKWVHRSTVYEEMVRIPLLIRYDGVVSPGLVVTAPVQTTDVLPSILDWIGLPIPGDLHGTSLSALAQGEPVTQTRDVFSEVDGVSDPALPGYWSAPRHDMRSIRRGEWKYIHHLGQFGADELFRVQPSSLYEPVNLLESEPEMASALLQALIDWFDIPTPTAYVPVVTASGQALLGYGY